MSVIRDYNFLHIFDYEKKLLLFCGIYPYEGRMKLLHTISRLFHLIIGLLSIIQILISIVTEIEYESLPLTISLLMTFSTSFFKLSNLLIKHKKLLQIEAILSNQIFYDINTQIIGFEAYVRPKLRICLMFMATAYVTVTIFLILPLMAGKKYSLQYSVWFPYTVDTYFKYIISFTLQCIANSSATYITIAIDNFTYKLITIVSYNFEVLKSNLTNIAYEKREAKKEFSNNVRLHYQILKLMANIQDIFSHGIFFQFVFSVVVICFLEFQLSIIPPSSAQFTMLAMYFCTMLSQVALYCWFGHNIISSSENINDAIYMSNWYEADVTLKKSIIIFMERCKNNEVLIAANLFPLSLQTFSSIIRSSYSYLAVLQSIYDKQ